MVTPKAKVWKVWKKFFKSTVAMKPPMDLPV